MVIIRAASHRLFSSAIGISANGPEGHSLGGNGPAGVSPENDRAALMFVYKSFGHNSVLPSVLMKPFA